MFAVRWQLQLFCKVGFCAVGLCALQMCCNVRWAVRDFELNVLSLEGERNVVVGLRTTFCIGEGQGLLLVMPGADAKFETKILN